MKHWKQLIGIRRLPVEGEIFGSLTVTGNVGKIRRNVAWECVCMCGSVTMKPRRELLRGEAVACRCLGRRAHDIAVTTHGLYGSPTYGSWQSMKRRCHAPTDAGWLRYGGRGITVCERWQDFNNFLSDMGVRPPGKSLDRIDNDGNYEPGNCRWATVAQQCNNRRTCHMVIYQGQRMTIRQAASLAGIKYFTFFYRIRAGWSMDRACGPSLREGFNVFEATA